jgi:hypothetical protein
MLKACLGKINDALPSKVDGHGTHSNVRTPFHQFLQSFISVILAKYALRYINSYIVFQLLRQSQHFSQATPTQLF